MRWLIGVLLFAQAIFSQEPGEAAGRVFSKRALEVWSEPMDGLRIGVRTGSELLVSIQNVGSSVLDVVVGERAAAITYGFGFEVTSPNGKVCRLRTTDPAYFLPVGGVISPIVMRLKPGYIREFPYQFKYLFCDEKRLDELLRKGYRVRALMEGRRVSLSERDRVWVRGWVGRLAKSTNWNELGDV